MHRSVLRITFISAALLALLTTTGDAQIGRRPVARKPINWLGANIGIVQGYRLSDGTTSSVWDFGSSIEYAARFEHPTPSGILVGLQASYNRAPLTYQGPDCGTCDAKATVTQFMGVAHYGQGYTFHPVYELSVGAIGYSNFQQESTNARLGPDQTDYDLRLAIGYGLGFGFSPSTSIEIVQEIGTILHQKTGLAGSSNNYPRVLVTRIGGKIAF